MDFWQKQSEFYKAGREKMIYFDQDYITFFQHKGVWQVFTYAEASEILSNHQLFSNAYLPEIPNNPLAANINQMDPPRHTLLRKLLVKAFSPSLLNKLIPWINNLADSLVETSYAKGEFDFISSIANPFPSFTINRLLGVPGENFEQVQGWVNNIVAKPDLTDLAGSMQKQQQTFMEMILFFQQLIAEKQMNPGEDLISNMLQVEEDSEQLSMEEVLGTTVALMLAGNDTTAGLIGNAAQYLCDNQDFQSDLWSNPAGIPGFIREVLRMRSPVKSHCRLVTMDMEYKGHQLKKNDIMNVWIGSANQDERRFSSADQFLITRGKDEKHLSFGHGVHYCVGAVISQLEVEAVFNKMAGMKKNIALKAGTNLSMANSDIVATIEKLPIVLL